MMNMIRGEAFPFSISFDGDVETLCDFSLELSQRGRLLLRKKREDAVMSEDGQSALITFSGEETARLSPYEPAFAQVQAELQDGEKLHSAVEEINIVDVLGGEGGRHGH